jgi:membrane protease YdiL (CAAX protease family)
MSALLTALGVTMIVFPIAVFLRWISADLMQRIGRQPAPQQSVQMLQTTVALAPQIYLAIQAIVFAPITEELLFRGILYPSIKQQGYPKLALLITSVLFGALHLNLMLFVPLTFLGLMLGWLYEKTDNLGASIFAHSFFNLANYLWAVWGKQTT